MSPEFIKKWEHLLEGVEKQKVPLEFIKKIVLRLDGRKQKTINIEKYFSQSLEPEEIEEVITRIIIQLEDDLVGIEFVLNVKTIANAVQPKTDQLLKDL